MAWLTGWGYRKSHVINYASGAGINYQVGIKVYRATGTDGTEVVTGVTMGKVYVGTKCRTDFGDVRFTDDDQVTLLDCWMESKVDGSYAIFWVEVKDDLSTVNRTIYVYYGKSDATYPYLATDLAQGEATFPFFDNFSVSPNGWTLQYGGSISGGNLIIPTGTPVVRVVAYKARPSLDNYRFRLRLASCTATNNGWYCSARGFSTDTTYPLFRAIDYYYNPLTNVQVVTQGVVSLPNLAPARDSSPHIIWYTKYGSSFVNGWDTLNSSGSDATTETGTLVTFGYWGSINAVANIDWVFLAKFVSPEPAHSTWGSEETPPIVIPTVTTQDATNIERY